MKTIQSRDGTTLAYDIYGSGLALIYITGASCFRSFLPVVQDAKAFAKEFAVYTYDRRGRGDSDDRELYAIEREVEDIGALIEAAGGRASLYGIGSRWQFCCRSRTCSSQHLSKGNRVSW